MPFANRVRFCAHWAFSFVVAVVALAASDAKSAVFDPPSETSLTNPIWGTTPNGMPWSAVASGTVLPVRTSATSTFNGAPGAVVYFNVRTGQMQFDPRGWDINALIITYTTGTVNISSTTPGPFPYANGTNWNTPTPQVVTEPPKTFPAIEPLTGLPPTTSPSRLAMTIGSPLSPSLATTGDPGTIASTNGYWNLPWSFPLDTVASGSVSSMVISNFKTIGQNSNANANVLGYGLGFCTFQYGINGVVGNQVGAVVPVAVPEPSTCAMALAGLACGGYSVLRRRERAGCHLAQVIPTQGQQVARQSKSRRLCMNVMIRSLFAFAAIATLSGLAEADSVVTPGPSVSANVLPFGGTTDVRYQQIYSSSLFTAAGVTAPIEIIGLRFSPDASGVYSAGINLRLNQTTTPVDSLSTSLDSNVTGALATVLANPSFSQPLIGGDLTYTLRLDFASSPFLYDPTTGQNLLMDVTVTNKAGEFAFYRGGDTGVTSRATSDFADGLGLRTLVDYRAAAIPEPSSMALAVVGGLACLLSRLQRRGKALPPSSVRGKGDSHQIWVRATAGSHQIRAV